MSNAAALRDQHAAALKAVNRAEISHAVTQTEQSAKCVVSARRHLSDVELLLIQEGANVDG